MPFEAAQKIPKNPGVQAEIHAAITKKFGLGTVSASGGDTSTAYAGYQVMSGAGGAFSFQIAPLSGGGTVQFTSQEVTGSGSGATSHTFTVAASRQYDFNSGTLATAPDWTGVRGNQLFGNGTSGFGWQSAVKEYDRGSASTSPALMYRDGHSWTWLACWRHEGHACCGRVRFADGGHELGHVLGLEDVYHNQNPHDVMQGVLERGLSRQPEARLKPLSRFGSLHDTAPWAWNFVAQSAVELLGMRTASASGPRMISLSTGTVDRVLATALLDDFRLADEDESDRDVLSDLLAHRRYEADDADAFFAEFERQEEIAPTAD